MNTIFNPPPISASDVITHYKLSKSYDSSQPSLTLTVNTRSRTYSYLMYSAGEDFRERRTRDAFVRCYYLLYALCHMWHQEDALTIRMLCAILDVSKPTVERILSHLNHYDLIDIDKNAWYDSVQLRIQAQKYGVSCELDNFRYKCGYPVPTSFPARGYASPPLNLSFFLPQQTYTVLFNLGLYFNPKLPMKDTILKERGGSQHFISQDSFRNMQADNKIDIAKNEVFVPDYSKLGFAPELLNMPLEQARQLGDVRKLALWNSGRSRPVKLSSGRLFHCWHNTPRVFRKYIEYNGSKLVEAMDIHNAFFVIMVEIFRMEPSIKKEELCRYEKLVRSGKLYEEIMRQTENPIREQVKQSLNAYRNDDARSMSHYPVHRYFKTNFPTITKYLMRYPTYSKKGVEVKYLQVDASHVETVLMSKVCFSLSEYGVVPFSLHDAIYISEADKARLDERGISVEALFWIAFDSMTDEEIKDIISVARHTSF